MIHLGDITKINGVTAPVVDVITGGSPCQDLSVAGKRAGLDGARSGLFMEQIRIVKEMRKKYAETHGANEPVRPRFMVWENVPGAFSSNGGKDFQTVLTEIVRISEPNAVNVPLFGGGANVGLKPGCLWESEPTDSRFPLPTEYTMRNFGEYPNEERESRLSQILEVSPHPKYYLSAKACQGILNRAKRRGKELPKMLLDALTRQASVFRNEPENQGGAKES